MGDTAMITFEVNDMSCGHCAGAITQALKSADSDAKVDIDLGRHRVQVEPGAAGPSELGAAIRQAGYTPVLVPASAVADTPPARRGGCCA
jgi:copper chaperone